MAFNLINFKKGTLAGLNAIKQAGTVEEGTFYLTIDNNKQTSRLYIGTGTTTALPVNSNIAVVTNRSDLSNAHATNFNDGDFAYVTSENILAVRYNGVWTQINAPDTRAPKSLTPEVSTTNEVATISWKLRDNNGNILKEADPTNADVVTDIIPSVTVTGANGVSVNNSGKALTVTGTSYELTTPSVVANSNTAYLKLNSKASASATAQEEDSITIRSGDSNVRITGSGNEVIISTQDTQLASANGAPVESGTGFNINVIDTLTNQVTATIDPKITLGTHTAAADQIGFTNGVANLPVYTKDEIDSMNRSLDAVVYRGTVGAGGSKGNSIANITEADGIQVGYAYKLVGEGTTSYTVTTGYNSETGQAITTTAHGGDIIIANGTESDGTITSASLFFDIIPSGDEKLVFKGLGANGTGNGIQIEDGSNTVLSSVEIKQGSQIQVTSTHQGTNGEKAEITVAHGTISSSQNGDASTSALIAANTQSPNDDLTINAVTGITTNNGHVTGVAITPFKVIDTVSKFDTQNSGTTVTVPASGAADYQKSATVESTVALVDDLNMPINDVDLTFTLRSDNLQITSSGTTITANYVWGTFGTQS